MRTVSWAVPFPRCPWVGLVLVSPIEGYIDCGHVVRADGRASNAISVNCKNNYLLSSKTRTIIYQVFIARREQADLCFHFINYTQLYTSQSCEITWWRPERNKA